MKAWVLHGIGDIRFEDVPVPEPQKGEVLIKVMACGICGSDIPRIFETGAHNMPLIPGHEFSGVVVKTGEGTDPALEGQRVGVFPLIPCGKCACCKDKKYEMCAAYDYTGSRSDGGFAEYVKVPEWNLIKLPDRVSSEAAAMLEPQSVAVHAIRRALKTEKNKEGPFVIWGLGTIGLLLASYLKDAAGNKIFLVGNKDFQKGKAEELGFPEDCFFDARKSSAKKIIEKIFERTDGKGAGVFFECVGKNETFLYGIETLAPEGVLVTVGNPASDMDLPRNVYWRILRKQLRITGTWNSSFTHEDTDDWHYVLEHMEKAEPEKLITHRLPLRYLERGLHIMKDKSEDYCKIMVSYP